MPTILIIQCCILYWSFFSSKIKKFPFFLLHTRECNHSVKTHWKSDDRDKNRWKKFMIANPLNDWGVLGIYVRFLYLYLYLNNTIHQNCYCNLQIWQREGEICEFHMSSTGTLKLHNQPLQNYSEKHYTDEAFLWVRTNWYIWRSCRDLSWLTGWFSDFFSYNNMVEDKKFCSVIKWPKSRPTEWNATCCTICEAVCFRAYPKSVNTNVNILRRTVSEISFSSVPFSGR